MRDLFAQDKQRYAHFSLGLNAGPGDVLVDYSKNRITAETMRLLHGLARAADVPAWIAKLLSGERVNITERRPALHSALRDVSGRLSPQSDIVTGVTRVLADMRAVSNAIRSGAWVGATGERIDDIVHIGVGGSQLGPQLAVEALAACAHPRLSIHFLSNVDGAPAAALLSDLDPARTLFIVASKTFETEETLTNADTARTWLESKLGGAAVAKHFVAVTANRDGAVAFGVSPENIFEFWNWVGGRFSLWSAVGLPVAIAIGMDRFEEMLAGAHRMDRHFAETPLEQNIPVTLALLTIWYNNFFRWATRAVLPYDEGLRRLPAYLQQLEMESNGKSTGRDGRDVACDTSPVIWGEPGTNAQHAFFQMLHQGKRVVPCDFIVCAQSAAPLPRHQGLLAANCFAQSEALMLGRTEAEAVADLAGLDARDSTALAPHRTFPGNRPSTTILIKRLDPTTLGMLLALYEHKVFVQGVIWGVNPFDQWGVELGKKLARNIAPELEGEAARVPHDASTAGLIAKYREWK